MKWYKLPVSSASPTVQLLIQRQLFFTWFHYGAKESVIICALLPLESTDSGPHLLKGRRAAWFLNYLWWYTQKSVRCFLMVVMFNSCHPTHCWPGNSFLVGPFAAVLTVPGCLACSTRLEHAIFHCALNAYPLAHTSVAVCHSFIY